MGVEPTSPDRATPMRDKLLHRHAQHAGFPLPEVEPCYQCVNNLGSWKKLTLAFYGGDPFSQKGSGQLPTVEPQFFRPGSGIWGGTASF